MHPLMEKGTTMYCIQFSQGVGKCFKLLEAADELKTSAFAFISDLSPDVREISYDNIGGLDILLRKHFV